MTSSEKDDTRLSSKETLPKKSVILIINTGDTSMQIEITNDNENYKPITLKITLDTLNEYKAFYQVTNWSSLIEETIQEESGTRFDIDKLFSKIFNCLCGPTTYETL